MTDGVLVIYKERGWTSFDVVARLRNIFHIRKIGHTGTLDPDAEGVLPVCIGKATKLVEQLSHGTKTYRCTMLLGRTTDTQDLSGTVLSTSPVHVSEEEVRKAVYSFSGRQKQIPPMYSALKVHGKKLVDLARRGIEIERSPRDVEFSDFKILEIRLPSSFESESVVSFEVTCSHGAYIRTLCHDIGQKLGCGAAMKSLLRTRVEDFTLNQSLRISELEKMKADEDLQNGTSDGPYSFIIPVDHFFGQAPAFCVSSGYLSRALSGNPIPWSELSEERTHSKDSLNALDGRKTPGPSEYENGLTARVYTDDGIFIGTYRTQRDGLKLETYFYENHT